MNYTEKRLERTIEQIGIASYGGISFIPSSRYKSDLIKILTKLTHQALAEERESVRKEIEFVKTNIACHRTRGIDADSGDDARQIGWDGACDLILSSLPLTDKDI